MTDIEAEITETLLALIEKARPANREEMRSAILKKLGFIDEYIRKPSVKVECVSHEDGLMKFVVSIPLPHGWDLDDLPPGFSPKYGPPTAVINGKFVTREDYLPGSDAAMDAGCTCPCMDNARGKGRGGSGEEFGWFTTENCEMHGHR